MKSVSILRHACVKYTCKYTYTFLKMCVCVFNGWCMSAGDYSCELPHLQSDTNYLISPQHKGIV